MQNLRIQPITAMFQPLSFTFVKEAAGVGVANLAAHPDLAQKWEQFQASGNRNWSAFVGSLAPEEKTRLNSAAAPVPPNAGAVDVNGDGLPDAPAPAPAPAPDANGDGIPDTGAAGAAGAAPVNNMQSAMEQMQRNIQLIQKGIEFRRKTIEKNQKEIEQLQATIPGGSSAATPETAAAGAAAASAPATAPETAAAPAAAGTAPAAPAAPAAPSTNKGWGAGVGDFARQMVNIPGNAYRAWQGATPQTANSGGMVLTASMGSPSVMFLKQNLTASR